MMGLSSALPNVRWPFDPAFACVKLWPYSVTGKGSVTGVLQSSQWLPMSVTPGTRVPLPVENEQLAQGVGVGVAVGPAAQYLPPVFTSKGLNPPQTIISLPVQTAAKRSRPVGALMMLVAVQLSAPGLYLPPLLKALRPSLPPQTIISLPVQTAVKAYRPGGALVRLVASQLSVLGLYLPPVLIRWNPPQTIISLPVHIPVKSFLLSGALTVLVGIQLSAAGSYLPPVTKSSKPVPPPQTIISLPVHTAACSIRPEGAPVVLVAVQLSVPGSYLPPVSK